MYYFRFEIGVNADGTRASYSPGWHGVLALCPNKVVVDLYDDEQGFGLAHTEDTFKPPEVTILPKDQHDKLKKAAKDADKVKDNPKVFYGDKLKNRKWDAEVVLNG